MPRPIDADVEVSIVLRQHVDVVEDDAVEGEQRARHLEADVHNRRFVEHVRRRLRAAKTNNGRDYCIK